MFITCLIYWKLLVILFHFCLLLFFFFFSFSFFSQYQRPQLAGKEGLWNSSHNEGQRICKLQPSNERRWFESYVFIHFHHPSPLSAHFSVQRFIFFAWYFLRLFAYPAQIVRNNFPFIPCFFFSGVVYDGWQRVPSRKICLQLKIKIIQVGIELAPLFCELSGLTAQWRLCFWSPGRPTLEV